VSTDRVRVRPNDEQISTNSPELRFHISNSKPHTSTMLRNTGIAPTWSQQ